MVTIVYPVVKVSTFSTGDKYSFYYHMMEVHVSENAATNRSLEKDFSAPSARSLRRAIEILGWVAVSTLVITRLVAIFDRAGFFFTSSMEFIDPNATFYPSDGRYVQFSYRAERT